MVESIACRQRLFANESEDSPDLKGSSVSALSRVKPLALARDGPYIVNKKLNLSVP